MKLMRLIRIVLMAVLTIGLAGTALAKWTMPGSISPMGKGSSLLLTHYCFLLRQEQT